MESFRNAVSSKGTIAEQKKVLIDELNFNITILKHSTIETTTIAQWIRLSLLYPGVEFQAQHLCLFQYLFELGCEKNENNQKRRGLAHIKEHNTIPACL